MKRLILGAAGAPTKYRAQPIVIDGIRFPSKKQGARYQALKLLESAGRVRSLRLEVPYPITVNHAKVCTYRADFVYEESTPTGWRAVVEDVKGVRTRDYILKSKLMKAVYGIEIRET